MKDEASEIMNDALQGTLKGQKSGRQANRKMRVKGTKQKAKGSELPLLDKWDGTPESKARLHRDAQVVLRALAIELGFAKNEFDVHSNVMGPAIGGAIYLNTPAMRMWIDGGYGFHPWGETEERSHRVESYVMARRCKDGKDEDLEHDLALDWELFWDVKKLAEVLRLEGFAS